MPVTSKTEDHGHVGRVLESRDLFAELAPLPDVVGIEEGQVLARCRRGAEIARHARAFVAAVRMLENARRYARRGDEPSRERPGPRVRAVVDEQKLERAVSLRQDAFDGLAQEFAGRIQERDHDGDQAFGHSIDIRTASEGHDTRFSAPRSASCRASAGTRARRRSAPRDAGSGTRPFGCRTYRPCSRTRT